jgi:amphi-Trp domain-containing protein
MAKETFELARIASPEEIADYLSSLAAGVRRGEVSLESPKRTLRLTLSAELTLAIEVKESDSKGKILLRIGWKRRLATNAADLHVAVGHRTGSLS